MKIIKRLKYIGFKLFGTALAVLLISSELIAQGPPGLPGFPSEPSAAPIDGGLGLLAAAGGAYAFKKLRERNGDKEIVE